VQNAVFADQNDVFCIVVLQVALDITSLAPFEMIFEDLNRCTHASLEMRKRSSAGCIN